MRKEEISTNKWQHPGGKLREKGAQRLTEQELLAILISSGIKGKSAEKIAEDVIRRIIGLGVDEITTNYIRELVCLELTQRGMNKYRNLFQNPQMTVL